MEHIPTQPLTEFARAFVVNGAHIGWFFGAGTSASGGVPTAGQLLDEFKAILYASETGLDRGQVLMADPLVAERVRRYFDNANGLPPLNDPEEYAIAFERTYPDPAIRRKCLDKWIEGGRPSYGHRVLSALIAAGLVRWVATTNFDDLVERTYEHLRGTIPSLDRMTVAALDSSDRAARAFQEDDWPVLVKLHGDIASDRLKNTAAELQDQDEALRSVLLDVSRRAGLAVVGYSGRDASVMQTLRDALDEVGAFPHGLHWLTSKPSTVFAGVRDLLEHAREKGVDAKFVEAANFDEVFGVLARHASLPSVLSTYVYEGQPQPHVVPVALPTVESGRFPALRLNALPVLALPKSALLIRCTRPVPGRLRPLLGLVGMPGFGIPSGLEVLGFGLAHGWRQALEEFDPETIEEVVLNLSPDGTDSVTMGLLNEGIARALARDRPLRPQFRRAGHRLVVSVDTPNDVPPILQPLRDVYGGPLVGALGDGKTRWMEGVRLRLEWRLGQPWLVFTPWTFTQSTEPQDELQRSPPSRGAGADPAAAWIKERWVQRRNQFWAAALGAWAEVLVGGDTGDFVALGLGDPRAVDAHFTLGQQTAYSLPAAEER